MVPSPYLAKKQCHTPTFSTTISRDPTKQHIILPYTKYLHLTRVSGVDTYLVPGPNQAKQQCHTPNCLNYKITRPYQTTYYFALHKIFTSDASLSRGTYMIPGPYPGKKYCHTPNCLTTLSRDTTKQHIIMTYTKCLHLTGV